MAKNIGKGDGNRGLSIAAANALKYKFYASWQRLKSLGNKSKSMPTEVQLCILICSMFPDDSRVPIGDLVMYMMGLKLLEDVDDMFAARCRVRDLISFTNDLKYLRNGISDKIKLTRDNDGTDDGLVELLVGARDLAMLIPLKCPLAFGLQTIQEKWLEFNSCGDFYGLSLVLKKIKDYPIYLDYPKLALLQLQYREDSQVIPIDFFKGMEELRVLSMEIPFLPRSLYVPRSLTTLCIKVNKLEQTSWIGGLTNLEFLSVSTLSLTNIPREMGNLEKLRLLDLKKVNLAYIPPGLFSRMLKLEELYLPLQFGRWGCKRKQHDDCDAWEFEEDDDEEKISTISNEINDEEKVNASLNDIVSPSLNALHISIPNASVLPERSPIFKNIRHFKVHVPNYVRYQPIRKDMSNELHLTGDACDIKESGICDLMSRTEELSLIRVKKLKNVMYLVENIDLALLKKMIISECEELECVVAETEQHILPKDNYSFLKLESLHLSMLDNLKEICNDRWITFQWFSSLSQLSIRFCHKLKHVFSMSHFSRRVQLKDIQILDCDEIEGVFFEDEKANVPLILGYIENLDLHSLPKFIGFSVPKDSRIDEVHDEAQLSLIVNGIIPSCKEGSTSTFHGHNESFEVKENISTSKEDEELISPLSTNKVKMHLGDTQQAPFVENKDGLISPMEMHYVFSSTLAEKGFQILKRLKIAICDSISIVFLFDEEHASSKAFISLEELQLYGLRNLVHIWFQIPLKTSAFQNLQLLVLSECDNTYLFSPQVAKLLAQLQKVYISRCKKMKEIIVEGNKRSSGKLVLFPKLEHLELQYLPNLKIFSSGAFEVGFPVLRSLKFNQCNKMESFSTGDSWTPKLERIEINGSLCSLVGDLNATIMRCVGTWSPRIFTLADLKKATKNFAADRLLGEGGFGKVYKGWSYGKRFSSSESGGTMVVAIKKLSSQSFQRFIQWQSEVNFLSRLSHPNMIKLVGSCHEDEELLIVYEFMQRGSLENLLFIRNHGIESLSWELRLKIAIGAARGLAFLHSLEKKVIYRDFRPSHILLDGNYNAKISNFGVAILEPSGADSHMAIRFNGTPGYAAPEYLQIGYLTVKNDVYSFGVVLLELLTGLRAIDKRRPSGQQKLVEWLKPLLLNKRKFKNVIDSSIQGQYSSKAMVLAAQLCFKCLDFKHKTRPSMKEVLEALEQIDAIKERPQE